METVSCTSNMLLKNVHTVLYLCSLQFLIITRYSPPPVNTGLGLCYRVHIVFSEPLYRKGNLTSVWNAGMFPLRNNLFKWTGSRLLCVLGLFTQWAAKSGSVCGIPRFELTPLKYRDHSTAVRQAETRIWTLALSFVDVTNERSCTSTPPGALMACRGSTFLYLLTKCMRI